VDVDEDVDLDVDVSAHRRAVKTKQRPIISPSFDLARGGRLVSGL